MIAKVIWKVMYTDSGMVVARWLTTLPGLLLEHHPA